MAIIKQESATRLPEEPKKNTPNPKASSAPATGANPSLVNPQDMALVAAVIAGLGGGSTGTARSTQDTTVASDKVQINEASAKALLENALIEIGYSGKLKKKDLTDFVNEFNAEAARQIETAIRSTSEERTPTGTKPEDLVKTKANSITTKILSSFDPKKFTRDYIWSKVNFKDTEGLPTKAVQALGEVRTLARGYNLNTLSDVEIQGIAKDVAMGKKSTDDVKAQFANEAAIYYPQYAEKFKLNPSATLRDLNKPAIKILADTWEVDPDSIELDDPILDAWTRPDGLVGKAQQPPLSQLLNAAMNDRRFDKTTAAINMGKNSAIALASAMGWGI